MSPHEAIELLELNAELLASLKELLLHSGYTKYTDDDLRWEAEQGNGKAPILLRARAAISKAERRS